MFEQVVIMQKEISFSSFLGLKGLNVFAVAFKTHGLNLQHVNDSSSLWTA